MIKWRLKDFEGPWLLERHIEDNIGPDAIFSGKARFTPDGRGLIYAEDGWLSIEDQSPIRAERRYFWRLGANGDFEIFFADGRPFHSFNPAEGTLTARHNCMPDIYDVTYDFLDWPSWSAQWQVAGPRKDYKMHTRYTRADNDI